MGIRSNTGILTFYQLEAFTSNDISNNFHLFQPYRYVGEIGINNIIQIDKSINLKLNLQIIIQLK